MKSSLKRFERKEKEICDIKRKKINKNYSVHYKAVLTLVKVLKIVQREHPILIKFFLMRVYFASKIQNTKNRTKEKLRLCCEFRSVTAIRTVTERKNNFQILALRI